MDDELLWEGTESWFRGLGGFLFALVFLVGPAIATGISWSEGGSPWPCLGLSLLAFVSVFNVPRGVLRLYRDRLELTGLTGTRVIPFSEVLELTARRGLVSGQQSWTDVVTLRTAKGRVRLDRYGDEDLLWQLLHQTVFPVLAARHAEDLKKGRPVALGPVRLDRDGFQIEGGSYYWDELGEVTLTRDGVLLAIQGRPHEAAVMRPSKCPGAPLLYLVQAAMLEGREEPGDLSKRPPRGRRQTPLAGLPGRHPQLGELVFTRRIPLWAKLAMGALGLTGVLFLAGAAAWALGLEGPAEIEGGAWLAPGIGAFFLMAMVIGYFEPPGGDEFSVYQNGLAAPDRVLPWDAVTTLTLEATEHYTNGVYQYTNYSSSASDGSVSFSVSGFGPRIQAYWNWFLETLAPLLAQRDLDRIVAGQSVDYGFATLSADEIRWPGGALPWSSYHGHSTREGTVYVFSQEADQSVLSFALSQPNAHVFQMILKFWEHRAAELAAEAEAGDEPG